ncbi:MAG TPA: hypothetical protein VGB73_12060 [Pyrinomonadaceae bacterium]|jgi:hypothetical protein
MKKLPAKDVSDSPSEPARRTFAKSISAALLALASSPITLMASQRRGRRRSTTRAKEERGPQKKVICRPLLLKTHEPPIIITNGSLRFDLEKKLIKSGTGPYIYSIDGDRYTDISRIEVVAERKNGAHGIIRYIPRQRSRLKLWLQKKPTKDAPWGAISTQPQVTFTFASDADSLLSIESERQLEGDFPTHNSSRPYRYNFVYPATEAFHFRLAKWSLHRLSTDTVISSPGGPFAGEVSEQDDLGFQITVFFTHKST